MASTTQAKNERVTVYATFDDEDRERGYNGHTGMDVLHEVILVGGYPFLYNYNEGDPEHVTLKYYVAKITLPYSYLHIDFDDGASAIEDADVEYPECPEEGHMRYNQVLTLEQFLVNEFFCGTFILPEAIRNPEVEIEWLPASYNWDTEDFLMDGQDVRNFIR